MRLLSKNLSFLALASIVAIIIGSPFAYRANAVEAKMESAYAVGDSVAANSQNNLRFNAITAAELESKVPGQPFPDKINAANPDMTTVPEFFYPEYFASEYDLDADGMKEIFVYVSGAGMCGSHGCALRIYKLTSNDQWLNILGAPNHAVSSSLQVCILDSKEGGYFNIGLNCSENAQYPVWRWNGSHYTYLPLEKY